MTSRDQFGMIGQGPRPTTKATERVWVVGGFQSWMVFRREKNLWGAQQGEGQAGTSLFIWINNREAMAGREAPQKIVVLANADDALVETARAHVVGPDAPTAAQLQATAAELQRALEGRPTTPRAPTTTLHPAPRKTDADHFMDAMAKARGEE